MSWLWIGLGTATLVLLTLGLMSFRVVTFRKSGDLPPPGKATMADVQRLIRAGESISAIKCYREIHHVGLAEAKEAVEAIAEQMKLKNEK